MAKKITWSETAQKDRIAIFNYWNNRNSSTAFSQKLNVLLNEAINIIAMFPQIGKPLAYKGVRIKIVRDYLVVYKVFPDFISIISIWDARQDARKLDLLLE